MNISGLKIRVRASVPFRIEGGATRPCGARETQLSQERIGPPSILVVLRSLRPRYPWPKITALDA